MDTQPIPLFTVYMTDEVDKPLLEVLHSGYIGQGAKVDEFEQALADYIGNKNVLTVNSATSGLHLALRLAGVGEEYVDDEVITTAMTCTATNMPILANNGTIVWADINQQTGLIDPLDVERKITERTKAIICVDWGGTPCDLARLMAIGQKYNIKIIEDAAHAFGATYDNRRVGTIADFTVFSFQAIKHITTIDGGAVFCKDTNDYKRGKLLRWYGIDREGERKDFRCEEDIKDWGYKFHMNDVNAVIGIQQLKHADEIIDKHRSHAAYYNSHLNQYFFDLPKDDTLIYTTTSAYWLYTILLPTEALRLAFMQFMKEHNVMVSQVHARNDTHTTFRAYKANLPGVETFCKRQVSIPVHWRLTDKQVHDIAELCNTFANEHGFVEIDELATLNIDTK